MKELHTLPEMYVTSEEIAPCDGHSKVRQPYHFGIAITVTEYRIIEMAVRKTALALTLKDILTRDTTMEIAQTENLLRIKANK